jgi:predicted RNA-binding protein
MKYWINTVSRDHVLMAKAGGFIQAGHGNSAPLKRLSKGDQVIYYSPRTSLGEGEAIQRFTAVCQISDDLVYQNETGSSFCPYRRDAIYRDALEVEIRPLIPHLSFIGNKKSWGYAFRFGLFPIPEEDFLLIAREMNVRGDVRQEDQR